MEEIINKFKRKFYSIRDMGYVKSVNNLSSGVGLTFERLMGKPVDNFPLPDFENLIEIKTKLAYSKRPIHLFNLSPDGNSFCENKRLIEKYGYNNMNNRNLKAFHGTVFANKISKIGYNRYFTLKIDYKEEMIKLLVYDEYDNLIDNSSYWDFDKIEIALKRKMQYLALVQAWSAHKEGNDYYKYYRYDLYKLSNIYNFIHLIEKGIISITFSMGAFYDEEHYGKVHDHGTTFDIQKEDLNKLFYIIE